MQSSQSLHDSMRQFFAVFRVLRGRFGCIVCVGDNFSTFQSRRVIGEISEKSRFFTAISETLQISPSSRRDLLT